MVNCSYCNKEIDRQVFCKPSHKVMFHQKGTQVFLAKPLKESISTGDVNKIQKVVGDNLPPYDLNYEPENKNETCDVHGIRYWDCIKKHPWCKF